jgi:hypothetical protein
MITQAKPPRLPQLWSDDWKMGESIVVEAVNKDRIKDSAYSLRRSRGTEQGDGDLVHGKTSRNTIRQKTVDPDSCAR